MRWRASASRSASCSPMTATRGSASKRRGYMVKFLIYPALAEKEVAELRAVADDAAAGDVQIVNAHSEEEALQAIVDADGLYGTITPDLLSRATRLRWLQTPVAGLE